VAQLLVLVFRVDAKYRVVQVFGVEIVYQYASQKFGGERVILMPILILAVVSSRNRYLIGATVQYQLNCKTKGYETHTTLVVPPILFTTRCVLRAASGCFCLMLYALKVLAYGEFTFVQ
jgi:hypothetical protein